MKTIHQYLEKYSQISPQKTALIDAPNNRSISYFELYNEVEMLASRLNNIINEKDLVVVISRNRFTLVEYILACSRIGVSCLPIVEPEAISAALDAVRKQQAPIVIFEQAEDHEYLNYTETWIDIACIDALEQSLIEYVPNEQSPFYINTTGGTTGLPKLVVASQQQVLNNTLYSIEAFDFHWDDVHLSSYQFHAHDWFVRGICTGGKSVLIENGLDYANIIKEIVRYRPTALMIGPHVLQYILLRKQSLSESLRLIECGGSKLDPEIITDAKKTLGVGIAPVWGSTETTGVALCSIPGISPPGSVGKPIGGYQVEVINASGKAVAPGEVGQMIISSKAVANSYLDKNKEYEGLSQGIFYTGDLVRVDANGFFYIVGRMNSQFLRFGFTLNSEIIESVLNKQDEIESSMVVPLPCFGGFRPVALIQRVIDGQKWADALPRLKTRIENELDNAVMSFPTEWLVIESIPRKPSGKLDRQLGYTITQEHRYLSRHKFSLKWKSYLYFLFIHINNSKRFFKIATRAAFSIHIGKVIKRAFMSKRVA